MNQATPTRIATAFCICLAFVTFPYLGAQAQTPETHSYQNGRSSQLDPLTRNSFSGTSFQSTLDYFKRKGEEAELERAAREKQLRAFGNYGNIPDKLRDSYFGQPFSQPYYAR
jgi:hypothetical protein